MGKYYELESGDEELLEERPTCVDGYMVPTYGNWYQCSECGFEAEEDALKYCNVTGGLSVEKLGTAPAMPYKEEIEAVLNK